ncbi:hypothetical protein [Nitrososphaera sp.]|uniref:hypothetical protein n=1 Tax=Nitrososphaera sp. TaxID=1971748 RepID=UPI003179A891
MKEEDPYFFALIQESQKLASIAELMELMEEGHKDKIWLIDQIRKKRQRISLGSDMGPISILKLCSSDFISHMIGVLKNQELEEFEAPPPLTQTYHWFFTDIVAGSDPSLTTNEQARKIIVLNKIIERSDIFRQRDPASTLILPTGDGMAIGFSDSPEKPLKLALDVHKELYRYNKSRSERDRIYIRIGLDTGPVYIIKDLNGNENVWGPGIIVARRVMDLAREMNILASARFANDVKMLKPEYKNILRPIGDYQIKHGEKLLIYNVYGDGFGNKKPPSPDKRQTSKAAEETQKTRSKFLFANVELELEVEDPVTMLTHHTLLWNPINISNEPIERIFCYLDGDVPKAFPDMNVTIKDEEERELEIISLNVNKPYHKEFFVKAGRPLKPGEKGRLIKLEWDWEEQDRQFTYRFASDCKKFAFLLTVPKGLEVHQKVVKVDTESGEKILAPTPATVRFLPNRTEISWSASQLHAYDAYRFDW